MGKDRSLKMQEVDHERFSSQKRFVQKTTAETFAIRFVLGVEWHFENCCLYNSRRPFSVQFIFVSNTQIQKFYQWLKLEVSISFALGNIDCFVLAMSLSFACLSIKAHFQDPSVRYTADLNAIRYFSSRPIEWYMKHLIFNKLHR